MPQSGADERMAEVLVSLYANCPPGTGIQFHLFALAAGAQQLRRYANLRVEDAIRPRRPQWGRPARNDNLFQARPPARRPPAAGRAEVADRRLPLHDPGLPADAERVGSRRRTRDLNKRDELLALRDSMRPRCARPRCQPRLRRRRPDQLVCAVHQPRPHLPDRCADLHYDDGREMRDQIVDFDTIQDPHPAA
jgi:conjugal transfer ATP-binding protein TraC